MFDMETNHKTSLQVSVVDNISEMDDKRLSSLKVADGGFSPDEKYIIAHTNGGVTYCFLVERGKYIYKWGENDGLFSFNGERNDVPFKILPKNYLVQAGLSYKTSNTLFVRNLNNGETIRELQCGGYEIDQFVVTGNQMVGATASASTSYSSDRGSTKDVYVWNLEKGELISRVSNRQPINALCFIGGDDQYLLVCPWRASAVEVWYVGTVKQPCADAIQIHSLIGHSDDVLYVHLSLSTDTIVTSSQDNTLKLWALDRVLRHCDNVMALAGEKMTNVDAVKEALTTSDAHPCDPTRSPVKTTSIAVAK